MLIFILFDEIMLHLFYSIIFSLFIFWIVAILRSHFTIMSLLQYFLPFYHSKSVKYKLITSDDQVIVFIISNQLFLFSSVSLLTYICFISFYFILFYLMINSFILFYFISFIFILIHNNLFYLILFQ